MEITVSCFDFEVEDDDIEYHFQVSAGPCRWTITKTYNDFVALHNELMEVYTARQAPYLTGEVAFWKRTSQSTGEARMPKLEGYLSQLLDNSLVWEPQGLVVQVPDPHSRGNLIAVNKFTFDFLEMASKYRPSFLTQSAPSSGGGRTPISGITPRAETQGSSSNRNAAASAAEAAETSALISNSLASSARITSQIRLHIRDFTIYPKDRIDYNVQVTLCGHSWTCAKRFSEFEAFHFSMTSIFGEELVPDIESAKAPFWKRFDQDVATERQRFFEAYLREIIRDVDDWDPPLHVSLSLTRKRLAGDGVERIIVYVSQPIFEFLMFSQHTDELSADMAEQVVERNRAALPNPVKQVLQLKRSEVQRKLIRESLEKRRKQRTVIGDEVIDEMCHFLGLLDDDKDVLNIVNFFVKEGYLNKDVSAVEQLLGGNSASIAAAASAAGGGKSAELAGSAAAANARRTSMAAAKRPAMQMAPPKAVPNVGLTSKQLVQLSRAIFFDDTRQQVIKVLAKVLVDDDMLEQLMETVLYDWGTLREAVDVNLSV